MKWEWPSGVLIHDIPTPISREHSIIMSSKQVALVVGASRGIGRQVAIDLATAGYAVCEPDIQLYKNWFGDQVVVAAKSTSDATSLKDFPPDPNSQASTISTVEREIIEAGGDATAIAVDTRDFESVQKLVEETVKVKSSQISFWWEFS